MTFRNGKKKLNGRRSCYQYNTGRSKALRNSSSWNAFSRIFFQKKSGINLCRQGNWYNNHQSNMEMENRKENEVPLDRSWLNLFQALCNWSLFNKNSHSVISLTILTVLAGIINIGIVTWRIKTTKMHSKLNNIL